MTRCSKSANEPMGKVALAQDVHTRFARESLEAAVKSKQWDRATMFVMALANSKLHNDAASMSTTLRGAPQQVDATPCCSMLIHVGC